MQNLRHVGYRNAHSSLAATVEAFRSELNSSAVRTHGMIQLTNRMRRHNGRRVPFAVALNF